MFALPEETGSTEALEKQISAISGVSSVQVTDVRRAVG
jgi:translation elongation factor EF-1beta